jgi:hypothetical protein
MPAQYSQCNRKAQDSAVSALQKGKKSLKIEKKRKIFS